MAKLKELPAGSVDMVLADPPYGTTRCKWDSPIPFAPLWDELSAAFSDGGTELLNIGDSRRAARIIEGVDAGRHQTLAALERLGCFD